MQIGCVPAILSENMPEIESFVPRALFIIKVPRSPVKIYAVRYVQEGAVYSVYANGAPLFRFSRQTFPHHNEHTGFSFL